MEDVCAWCGRSLDDAVARRGRLVCAGCGAATTHPWPTDQELDEAYAGWYRPAAGRFGRLGDAVLERSRGALGKRVDEIAPVGPVVDVGAGDGTLVRALVAAGREANGLERGDGELAALSNPVAAVVFWHSLEHLRAPRAAVRAAARLLVSGGVVFIAVPNASSLQAQVFGDEWLALDLPRHLVHLPARTLLDGLAGDGWKLERVSYTRGGQTVFGWLHGLVGRLPGSLDLYQSIRSAQARSHPVSWRQRALALAAATVLLPIALACAAVECLLRRGGTVYVEARRV